MVINTAKMTAMQFFRLGQDPPGVRLELVNGEVAGSPSPAPNHSFVVMRLAQILGDHVESNNLGELHGDLDTVLDPFNVRRPDVLFVSNARRHLIGDKAVVGGPDLAIEVLSPSSVEIDREDKFEQYRKAGVACYWIVDPEMKTIEAWQLERGNYTLVGRGQGNAKVSLPPFPDLEIAMNRLWRK